MSYKNKEKNKAYQKKYSQDHKAEKKEYDKKYFQQNKEKIRSYKRLWDKKYRQTPKRKTYLKEYYLRNKEKIRARNKKYNPKYYQDHKDYFKTHNKKYSQQNKTRRNDYLKNKRKIDLHFLLCCRLRHLLSTALKRYSQTGKIMTSKKYGLDYKAIINHLKPLPKNLSAYEIHHIKPLFTFDFTNLEEIKKAFMPENHKLLLITAHRKIKHRGQNHERPVILCKVQQAHKT